MAILTRFFLLGAIAVTSAVASTAPGKCFAILHEMSDIFRGEDTGTMKNKWRMRRPIVGYLKTDEERAPYRAEIRDGVVLGADGKPLTTTDAEGDMFVVGPEGQLYIAPESDAVAQHSSFLAAGAVAFAGKIRIADGKITWLSDESGHYAPGMPALAQLLTFFESKGVAMADVPLELRSFLSRIDRDFSSYTLTAATFQKLYEESNGDQKAFLLKLAQREVPVWDKARFCVEALWLRSDSPELRTLLVASYGQLAPQQKTQVFERLKNIKKYRDPGAFFDGVLAEVRALRGK